VRDYSQFGARHCETGSLRNVLAHYGVVAPHTGQPFTEEMLLGIGGGIGMMYWVFQFGDAPVFFVGTRYGKPKTLLIEEVCNRLGIGISLCETASAGRAAADLEAVLSSGRPAPVWVDMPYLPYLGIPETAHFGGHVVVVYGIDDRTGEVLIADRASRPVRVTAEQLAAARGSQCKPFPPKHKMLEVAPPEDLIEAQTLERAVVRGISDCCGQLLHGPIENIGLAALRKWAGLVTGDRNAKCWRKVFHRPESLYGALMSVYIYIEIGGTGGSGFRPMFAGFLDEAAAVLRAPQLQQIAGRYRECAALWSEVARAALPDAVPELRQTRELLAEKNRVFEEQAPGALERMLAINERLEAILARVRERFPVAELDVPELLGGLSAAILRLHAAEVEAAEQLQRCLR